MNVSRGNRMSPQELDNRKFFVITGMHRSHTSLLGRMLVDAGIKFHGDMVDADSTNPYGHYEDVDFMRLQENILADNNARWFRGTAKEHHISSHRKKQAIELVEKRFAHLGEDWGFKVPHSTLFLDFWAQWPASKFLLIFREPRAVLSSMYRRMGRQFYYRPDAIFAMANAYVEYNRRIAVFRENHPARTYLMSSQDLMAEPERVIQDAARYLTIPLSPEWQGATMIDRKISSAPGQNLERMFSQYFASRSDVSAIYDQLEKLADSKTAL